MYIIWLFVPCHPHCLEEIQQFDLEDCWVQQTTKCCWIQLKQVKYKTLYYQLCLMYFVLGIYHIHSSLCVYESSIATVIVAILQFLEQFCMAWVGLPTNSTHLCAQAINLQYLKLSNLVTCETFLWLKVPKYLSQTWNTRDFG